MVSEQGQEVKVAGMGAVIHERGVFFRVWAPHATQVFVVGDFNGWGSPGIELEREEEGHWGCNVVDAKAGDEYKFFLKTPESEFFRNDPYALEVTSSVGNGVVYNQEAFDWEGDEFVMPSWNELVIYELHIGTFNVKEEGKPGDFYSAIERLPYLRDLGINAVEIMPVFEFPGGMSWGYNPSHPYAIESEYGGPDAFKEFVKACHRHGIGVILDVVYNHFGPSDLDLWQFDGWQENDGGGIYFYNDWRSVTPWGNTRPDYGRNEVRSYIHDNAMMWLDKYRVDGLRMDMVPYIRNVAADGNPGNDIPEGYTLIQWINDDIRKRFPQKITIAEDLHSLNSITNPVEAGGLGYGSQWDAQFVHPVRKVLIARLDEERSMEAVANAIGFSYNHDVFQRVIYTESHDEVANGQARVAEEIADGDVNNWFSKKRAALGIALVMTAPGIPMLFQGQPLLEDRWFSDNDPLDWSRLDQFRGYVALHRDLIRLRRNWHGQTDGLTGQHLQMIRVDEEKKVIAYLRWKEGGPGDTVMIVLNFSTQTYDNYAIGFPTSGKWAVRFNSDWKGYDEEFSDQEAFNLEVHEGEMDEMPFHGAISLAPYSAVIYSQDVN